MATENTDLQFIANFSIITKNLGARSRSTGSCVLSEGEPTLLRFQNTWIIINVGGGPTDDKPEVIAAPPVDHHRAEGARNRRSAAICATPTTT